MNTIHFRDQPWASESGLKHIGSTEIFGTTIRGSCLIDPDQDDHDARLKIINDFRCIEDQLRIQTFPELDKYMDARRESIKQSAIHGIPPLMGC